jgi:intracellular septation protein
VKSFFEVLPLLLFFVAFKVFGVFIATGVAIGASFIQVSLFLILKKKVEVMQWITLGILVIFGGFTLFFQDELYIKWKPTIVNFAFAAVFIGSQLFNKGPFIQKLLGSKIELPPEQWRRLNMVWALFFIFLGSLNLFVAYQFSTDVWVNFKIFGMTGLTLVFTLIQGLVFFRGALREG